MRDSYGEGKIMKGIESCDNEHILTLESTFFFNTKEKEAYMALHKKSVANNPLSTKVSTSISFFSVRMTPLHIQDLNATTSQQYLD